MISRRHFVQVGLTGLGTVLIPRWTWAGPKNLEAFVEDPHFFIQIVVDGGMDNRYLFDARPLAMTQKGLFVNYMSEEPIQVVGSNGQTCLRTRATDSLAPLMDRFSIINGVTMLSNFDGHNENMNNLICGDAFGGDSFIPHLNSESRRLSQRPLDSVKSINGFFSADFATKNGGASVSLNDVSAREILEKLKRTPELKPENRLLKFVRNRLESNATGLDRFSLGAQELLRAFDVAPSLDQLLRKVDLDSVRPPAEFSSDKHARFLATLFSLFRQGVSRSALIQLSSEDFGNKQIDTHDSGSAKQAPVLSQEFATKISMLLKVMSQMPYDDKRSCLDVTTFMVTSEFSRTMRQTNFAIHESGTDHNPLSNTVLIGGKGIKSGMVLGASDFAQPEEKLSAAHLQVDAGKIKLLGRPFDFATHQPRADLPATFKSEDYLNISSVINTIYSVFDVGAERHRLSGRDHKAPVLSGMLS